MNKIKIAICLSIIISIVFIRNHGMECPPSIAPIIVDYNDNQSIKTVIEKPALIGVFGATPRYSYFEKYIATLHEDYTSLREQYNKNARLKGVEYSKKEFLASIAKYPGLSEFQTYLTKASNTEKMKLFFAAGFDYKTIKTNIGILLKKAQKELLERSTKTDKQSENLYLTHLLLPSYFNDLPHFKNDLQASEKLHIFLKEVAMFYQDLYAQIATDASLKICLVIPQLKHFITAIDQGNTMDKTKTNTDIIQTELIELVGSDNGFILLNQEIEALKPIVTSLQQKGTPKVAGVGLPIFNARGHATTKFNPYLLQAEKKHSYQSSPLLNKELLDYVQKKFNEKKS